MLGNFLLAGAVMLPYWLVQRLRGHTTERHKHRRFRVGLVAFTTLCLVNVASVFYLAFSVPQTSGVGKALGKSAFWSIAPLVFLYRPKGPGWEALAPYKTPTIEV